MVVASLALQSIGATPVEVNRQWSRDTLSGIVTRTAARHAIVPARDATSWRDSDRGLQLWAVVPPGPLPSAPKEVLGDAAIGLLFEDGRANPACARQTPSLPQIDADAPALILYTSGSTGTPRGVVQSFANIDANTRGIVEYLGLSREDRALLVLPLYYCYGRSVLQTHLFAGGSVFMDNRLAFPRTVMEAIGRERCTGFAGVPLTFELMRRQVDMASLSLSPLRYVTQAGGKMAPETIAWTRAAFHPALLYVMYGQTEATARLTYLPPERSADKKGSIGIPIRGVELAIVDDDAKRLPAGEIGHLVARGATVTRGYLDDEAETRAILKHGWLWTGDLAFRDRDGFFFLQGRAKEMLKIGGHRVSPAEIEQVIAEHPDVAEAAVVAASDPLKGDVPAAFVVLRQDRVVSQTDIIRYCQSRMPAYRVPASVRFVASLPRNEAGKLLRTELLSRMIHV